METLRGKTVLVTGGASRLGNAVSLGCAGAGLRTAVHFHRSESDAAQTVSQIREKGGIADSFQADLSDPGGGETLINTVTQQFGLPDYLVSAQSGYTKGSLFSSDVEAVMDETALTGTSPLFLSRAWFKKGGRGAAVHILDARIKDNDRFHAAYHLAKRMLYSMTRASALEFAPDIRVNAVAPGLVMPQIDTPAALLDRAAEATLLHRIGDPAAVVSAVLFLLENDFITGQVIFVDGGRNLRGSIY